MGPDPELDGVARLAGALTGAGASLTLGPAPAGAIPLRGVDGEVRGGLLVETSLLDERQRAALTQLAAQAGALLERREREGELLDAVGALLATNDELALFAGRVAHDLRAPLTAVLGFLALADGPFREETSPRAARCVSSAHSAATRMRTLIDDLLAYATLVARPRVGPVELPALVAAVAADLGTGDLDYAGPAVVTSDATLVRQLVQNLVANALTHAGPDVAVRAGLDASPAGSGWWLAVVDHGPGVPPEAREKIFDPMVRLTGRPGSGLGLSTVAKIVAGLGALIEVRDTPGGGATFHVCVPGSEAPGQCPQG